MAGLACALALPAAAREPQTYRLFDEAGRPMGRAESDGHGIMRYYDRTGRPAGRDVRGEDGVTRQYDGRGRRTGTVRPSDETEDDDNGAEYETPVRRENRR